MSESPPPPPPLAAAPPPEPPFGYPPATPSVPAQPTRISKVLRGTTSIVARTCPPRPPGAWPPPPAPPCAPKSSKVIWVTPSGTVHSCSVPVHTNRTVVVAEGGGGGASFVGVHATTTTAKAPAANTAPALR